MAITTIAGITIEDLLSAFSLGAGKSVGLLVDAHNLFEYQVDATTKTGASSSATSGVTVAGYHAYGATALNSGSGVAAAATSLTVAAVTGLYVGQKIAIGGAAGTGEIVTISAIAGFVLTVSATTYAHGATDPVYLISQAAVIGGVTMGMNLNVANTTYSATLFVPTGFWWLHLTNTDATYANTVGATHQAITGVQ